MDKKAIDAIRLDVAFWALLILAEVDQSPWRSAVLLLMAVLCLLHAYRLERDMGRSEAASRQ